MILCFELSMPNTNSWNGRWSGEGNLYAKVVTLPNTQKAATKAAGLLAQHSWYYNFGDGWGASVSVRSVTSGEAARVRRNSRGFCGYDWMVDSIMRDGAIYTERHPKPEPAKAEVSQ